MTLSKSVEVKASLVQLTTNNEYLRGYEPAGLPASAGAESIPLGQAGMADG